MSGTGPPAAGYKCVRVFPDSPASEAGFEPFFDWLVFAGGVPVQNDDGTLGRLLSEAENKGIACRIFSLKTWKWREIHLTPRRNWGGAGMLGAQLLFSQFGETSMVQRVISVTPSSPAQKLGIQASVDFVLGRAVIENGIVRLTVYNSQNDGLRELDTIPNQPFGCNLATFAEPLKGRETAIPPLPDAPLPVSSGPSEQTAQQQQQEPVQQPVRTSSGAPPLQTVQSLVSSPQIGPHCKPQSGQSATTMPCKPPQVGSNLSPQHIPGDVMRHEGWLEKQGGIFKSWKKRYFTIDAIGVAYMPSPNSNPIRTIPLSQITHASFICDLDNPYLFGLATLPPLNRTFYAKGTSDEEARLWVTKINEILDAFRRGDLGGDGAGGEGSSPQRLQQQQQPQQLQSQQQPQQQQQPQYQQLQQQSGYTTQRPSSTSYMAQRPLSAGYMQRTPSMTHTSPPRGTQTTSYNTSPAASSHQPIQPVSTSSGTVQAREEAARVAAAMAAAMSAEAAQSERDVTEAEDVMAVKRAAEDSARAEFDRLQLEHQKLVSVEGQSGVAPETDPAVIVCSQAAVAAAKTALQRAEAQITLAQRMLDAAVARRDQAKTAAQKRQDAAAAARQRADEADAAAAAESQKHMDSVADAAKTAAKAAVSTESDAQVALDAAGVAEAEAAKLPIPSEESSDPCVDAPVDMSSVVEAIKKSSQYVVKCKASAIRAANTVPLARSEADVVMRCLPNSDLAAQATELADNAAKSAEDAQVSIGTLTEALGKLERAVIAAANVDGVVLVTALSACELDDTTKEVVRRAAMSCAEAAAKAAAKVDADYRMMQAEADAATLQRTECEGSTGLLEQSAKGADEERLRLEEEARKAEQLAAEYRRQIVEARESVEELRAVEAEAIQRAAEFKDKVSAAWEVAGAREAILKTLGGAI